MVSNCGPGGQKWPARVKVLDPGLAEVPSLGLSVTFCIGRQWYSSLSRYSMALDPAYVLVSCFLRLETVRHVCMLKE